MGFNILTTRVYVQIRYLTTGSCRHTTEKHIYQSGLVSIPLGVQVTTQRRGRASLTAHISACCKSVSGRRRSRCIWIAWSGCGPFRILQNTDVAKTFELKIWYSTCSERVPEVISPTVRYLDFEGHAWETRKLYYKFPTALFTQILRSTQSRGESCSYRWTSCAVSTLAVREFWATFNDLFTRWPACLRGGSGHFQNLS
jgi:hypothetical protein